MSNKTRSSSAHLPLHITAEGEELAALRAENERLTATPKCGRCGKREIPGVHTCTPTDWAREREAEIAELRKGVQTIPVPRGEI